MERQKKKKQRSKPPRPSTARSKSRKRGNQGNPSRASAEGEQRANLATVPEVQQPNSQEGPAVQPVTGQGIAENRASAPLPSAAPVASAPEAAEDRLPKPNPEASPAGALAKAGTVASKRPKPSAAPPPLFKSRALNIAAREQAKLVTGLLLKQAQVQATLALGCASAKAAPRKPEAQDFQTFSPDEFWRTFDPHGQKVQREEELKFLYRPSGPVDKVLLSQTTLYEGYSIIQRVSHLNLIKGLLGTTITNLHLKLAFVPPELLKKIGKKFCNDIEKAASQAEVKLYNSKLWQSLVSVGEGPDSIKPNQEQFQLISELSEVLSAGSRVPLNPSSSSSIGDLAPGSLIPILSPEERDNLQLPQDSSEEESEPEQVLESTEPQGQPEEDENWGDWQPKDQHQNRNSKRQGAQKDKDQDSIFLTTDEQARHKAFQLKYARGRLTVTPSSERIITGLPASDLERWISSSPDPAVDDAEFHHLSLIQQLAGRYLPDPEHKGRFFSQLRLLDAFPDQQGAWISPNSRRQFPWNQDRSQPFPPSPAKGKGKKGSSGKSASSKAAPWASGSSGKRATRSPKPSRPVEPSRAPAFPGADRETHEEQPVPRPPGFGTLLGEGNSERNYGLTSEEHAKLIKDLIDIKWLSSECWEHLGYSLPKAHPSKLCPRVPDLIRKRRQPGNWSNESKAKLRPAFCVFIPVVKEGQKVQGDGALLGGKGHPSDPGLNAACAALHSFQKLTSDQQNVEPPPELLISVSSCAQLRKWAKAFVRVTEVEARIRKYRAGVLNRRGDSKDWLKGTFDKYKSLHLRWYFKNILQAEDKETGFGPIPSDSEAQGFLQGYSLQPVEELQPRFAINYRGGPVRGDFWSEHSASVLNGIAAKSFTTATAVESATQIIHELLQFTVQGITCYQSRVAPTIAEACGALLAGGHCDALQRDFTISIAFVLCLFYRASGVAASFEAKNTGKPYSPKQLAKVVEATLYEVFTDPKGHFKQIPGTYPAEAEARKSACAFIAEVLGEATPLAFQPIDEPDSLCQQFLSNAIKDRQRDQDAETQPQTIQEDLPGDKFVQDELNLCQEELHQVDAGAQTPEGELPPLDSLIGPDQPAHLEPLDPAPELDEKNRALREETLRNVANPPTPTEDADLPFAEIAEEEPTELPPSTDVPST